MTMIRIAICDDDAVQIKTTRDAVEEIIGAENGEIDLFSDGMDLFRALEMGSYRPDIAILDIQMPGLDGITLGQKLNTCVPACQIIFLTSYLGYATEVYEVYHGYFILKSELRQRIGVALTRAIKELGSGANITFRADGDIYTVSAEEVLYLERNMRKIRVVCQRQSYTTGSRPEDLFRDIPSGRFVQCHQSYWVQMRHVAAMDSEGFTMKNGDRVPVSRSRRAEAKEAFFAVLHRREN